MLLLVAFHWYLVWIIPAEIVLNLLWRNMVHLTMKHRVFRSLSLICFLLQLSSDGIGF